MLGWLSQEIWGRQDAREQQEINILDAKRDGKNMPSR
jgi:hypothetical protein